MKDNENIQFDKSISEKNTEKHKKSKLFKPFMTIMIVCFAVYAAVQIIYQQAQIAELKKQTDLINSKITEAKQVNDEYNRLLGSDENEYMEMIAIDKLGYAYPNERRFYLVNGSKDK